MRAPEPVRIFVCEAWHARDVTVCETLNNSRTVAAQYARKCGSSDPLDAFQQLLVNGHDPWGLGLSVDEHW